MSRYQSVYERAVGCAKERLDRDGAPRDEQGRELLLAQIRVDSGCSNRTAQAVLKDVLLVFPHAMRQVRISEVEP